MQRLRMENIGVDSISRNDDGGHIYEKNKIKVVMEDKLRHLYITKVENEVPNLEKCTHSNLMKFLGYILQYFSNRGTKVLIVN